MKEERTDILIIGGGLGGVGAALAVLRLGKKVIMTEETDWIGGQLTAQAVPPDEHLWIETTGCTASYRQLREKIRAYYRRNYPLIPSARAEVHLNPGLGRVSPLCHEPRVALAALEEMLAPYRASRQLDLLLRHRPIAAETGGDRILSVTLLNEESGQEVIIQAPYILDATELGDLLELAGMEFVIGAESRDQTGELHAVEGDPQPLDQQAISWCFALDYLPGQDHTIDKPEQYDFWRSYQADFWPGPQLGWVDIDPQTLKKRHRAIFETPFDPEKIDDYWDRQRILHGGFVPDQGTNDFWHYRRILYRGYYPEGLYPSDITLVNWPQIDYWLKPLLGVSEEEKQQALYGAEQLSLSFLYWMQTESPTLEGGQGYPGLRLRHDIVGTSNGLAKYAYIRESRRIQAEFTVLEQHVGVEARGDLVGAEFFSDSVGIGSYRIDLHPSTGNRTYVDVSSYPFQIPLGALIPVRMENLLPACKNLGVTHITNGCYRLHPVEWNIGEAAGALAAYCLDKNLAPRQVGNTPAHLSDYQQMLTDVLGFKLAWPEYARITPR